jgi:RimJ/RimL family protein N-acetyltransferase
MKNPFLVGSRIYLRPLDRADAPHFVTWLNDSDVNRTLLRRLPLNLAAEEEFLGKLYQDDKQVLLGIVLRDGDRLIGGTGLHPIDYRYRHTGFGILIGDKAEWGKGHATEATQLMVAFAFQTLNLNRVWLHVYEDNVRGQRVYEKAGFRKEGILRQENYREGRYWDTITMAILREEWQGRTAGR